MAIAGQNSNGSQFFIFLIDTPWLRKTHGFRQSDSGVGRGGQIGGLPVDESSKPHKGAVAFFDSPGSALRLLSDPYHPGMVCTVSSAAWEGMIVIE
jgi:cyclophilin family peptidyl-prolyl cis-trans isomerase